jgi:Flp pilus assembly protein TadD
VTGPRAVVIPFGVPPEGKGLGLGLAALIHTFAQVDGQTVALAHLLAKKADESPDLASGPVEAFVPPHAWRNLACAANAPPDVTVVLTGALEPPSSGHGLIQLLAFDAHDGVTRAKAEVHLDSARAGETLVSAFREVWSRIGGELGMVLDLGDLGWEPLESVLRAEGCVLHDPTRNGPRDRLAAMLHLGRAVEDAPQARFPAGRLAGIALETAMAPAADSRLADAALRALTRAAEDAPAQIELLEATAALHVRIGNAAEAESRAVSAITQAPTRTRLYAVLSEARRALGNLDGALDAVDAGLARASHDAALVTERGIILAERGDLAGAERAWRDVLYLEPLNPAAFANMASLAVNRQDTPLAQSLLDQVLASTSAHPEVLRRAVHLALATESEGVARASRVAALTTALLERVPVDAWASLMLARAALQMGDKDRALEQLGRVQTLAPDSAFAAEAQRGFFALTDPEATMELESTLRAAFSADATDLEVLGARARRIATLHAVWSTWFTVGIIERRRQRWRAAREAFERALVLARGATPAHVELVGTCIALKDPASALTHAERVCALEGQNARTLGVLATALFALERTAAADAAIHQALQLDPSDASNLALAERIREKPIEREGVLGRLRRSLFGPRKT